VSAHRSTTSSKSSRRNQGHPRFAFDPYFAFLIFAAVGVGTLKLGTSPRLIILWTTLIALWLAFREGEPLQIQYRLNDIGRGAGIGLFIGVPLMLLAFGALTTAIPILYVSADPSLPVGASGSMIFASLVWVAPLAEELFFRDILHRERGFWTSIGLYAAAGVIMFLPTAGGFPAVLGAVSGATAILGILYAILYERYGLTTSLASHVTINLLLLFIPTIISHLDLFTQGGQ
jgi:membrane protease YdiL (CAAX protease family)